MKRLFIALALLTCIQQSFAQLTKTDDVKKSLESENKDTVAWLHGGVINVGINEGFLHNWAAGGEIASVTVNGLFSGYVTRLYHRQVWSNNLDMSYGLLFAQSNDFVARKTDDRIDLTSKYGVRIDTAKNFYLTGLFNFKSQFSKGYDYTIPGWDSLPTSEFLSPAYFTLAAGVEYRKGGDLSLFLSPIAARMTLAKLAYTLQKPEGAFGVQYGKKKRLELGAYFSGRYMAAISKTISYKTKLDLYCNYLAKDVKDSNGFVVKKDSPKNIDVYWDNLLFLKLSKYLNMSLGLTIIYDNDVPYSSTYVDKTTGATVSKNDPGAGLGWVQMKQIFTLGFNYKF